MTQSLAPTTPVGHLPCPPWCVSHSDDAEAVAELAGWDEHYTWNHLSGWRSWGGEDTPRFEFRIVRHDQCDARSDELLIGQIDFDVRVEQGEQVVSDCTDGAMSCFELRQFSGFLLALANEVDPFDLNGEPTEWHTPVRRPLLGQQP